MANSLLSNAKVYLCKYQANNLIMMMGSEKIAMDPTNIIAIEYLNVYEKNIRPILKVTLSMDVRKKMWILKNKSNITVKMELLKVGIDTDTEEVLTSPLTVWNQDFGIFFDDDTESSDTKVMEDRIAMNEGSEFVSNVIDEENYYESQNLLEVYLFNQKFLDASNKIYNEVFTNDTLQQCVGRLLTETGHSKILMSRFENDEVYSELLVPANPAYKGLIYLDQYYGFYRAGAMIYYDIDTVYILNTAGKCTAKKSGEFSETTIYITNIDDSLPGNGMIRKSDENRYYATVPVMNVNPQRPTASNNEWTGSEVSIVISDGTDIENVSADQSYNTQKNSKITYTKKDNNKFTASIMKARMEENESVLYISGDNLDISAFTPNKIYNVVFDDTSKQQEYGSNKYRLTYAYHFLKRESEGYMTASHRLILKKAVIV